MDMHAFANAHRKDENLIRDPSQQMPHCIYKVRTSKQSRYMIFAYKTGNICCYYTSAQNIGNGLFEGHTIQVYTSDILAIWTTNIIFVTNMPVNIILSHDIPSVFAKQIVGFFSNCIDIDTDNGELRIEIPFIQNITPFSTIINMLNITGYPNALNPDDMQEFNKYFASNVGSKA